MATRYVRSTDGSDADGGTTWALAKATMAGADAIDTAGDTIFLSQVHAESTAGNVTYSLAGTLASPTRVLCGNDAAEPPTALATTASITTTGSTSITLSGTAVYWYGVTFNCGTGSGAGSFNFGNTSGWQKYEQCSFVNPGTNAASLWAVPNAAGCRIEWKDCSVKFGATGHKIQAQATGGSFYWNGGSIVSGSTTPTVIYTPNTGLGTQALIENVDFSNLGTSVNLTAAAPASSVVIFRNCKLPGSWAGALLNGSFSAPGRVQMYNCDSGSTNYKVWIEDYAGTIRDETTLVRSGGASDGTTSLSWKMVANANAKFPLIPLASPEIAVWNDTTGSSKTVTVEILRDSATNLKENEIWLEVSYLGDSSTPKGTSINDAVDVLATGADQTTSSATWTTTGMSNPNKQKCSVSFTPQKKGFFLCRVMLAKASTTVYVDPMATVT